MTPCLVAPGTGGIGLDTVDGYKLQPDSPCIDSGMTVPGNGGLDYWGNPVPSGGQTDRGAHEYSFSVGDLDFDGDIDLDDLGKLVSCWLVEGDFIESGGLVVFESEHYTNKETGSGSGEGFDWISLGGNGASGDGYVQALPNDGVAIQGDDIEYDSPRLSYSVNFETVGTYYVWIKSWAPNPGADMLHYGLDGTAVSSGYSDSLQLHSRPEQFDWRSSTSSSPRPTIEISSPGLHMIDFWMYEDGARVDKVLLTTDSGYVPDDSEESADISGDIDGDGKINFVDFSIFAVNYWGTPVLSGPEPDPMTWDIVPTVLSQTSIGMTATTAVDDESGVQYYFNNVTDPNHDSGWQSSTYYEDTGLDPDTEYVYQVKARDTSPSNNETAYSTQESATTLPPDLIPPEPDPLVWALEPNAIGGTIIEMTATTATDDRHDVEYYFNNITDPSHDSGWQVSTYYEDTGLDPNTEYTYQVKARDTSPNNNETGWSTMASATTLDVDPDLVSHWALDDDSGTIASDSAGSNHGTLYGDPNWTAGQIGGALQFDGVDDYVALPNNDPIWLPVNNFTVSVWVYFERDPAAAEETIFDLNWGDSSNPSNELGYAISRRAADGTLKFYMTTTTNSDEDLISNTVLAKDQWYHIVAVRDGTTQAIYINGQPDISRTCSSDPIDFVGGYDDNKVNIGRFSRSGEPGPAAGVWYLDGKIDDVRIYDRALQSAEIQQLFDDAIGPDTTPPTPDPLVWALEPNAISSSEIEMTAATAIDDRYEVEYYFANITDPNHDSGWQSDTHYLDIGLDPNTEYTYQVQARDLSENLNATGWSTAASATTEYIVPNPVSHWMFDEGGGTTAGDSAGSNHGTLINGPTWTTGQIDGALSFDGSDDYVDVGTMGGFGSNMDDVTISTWIKSDITDSYMTILGTSNGSNKTQVRVGLNQTAQGQLGSGNIEIFIRDENGKRLSGSVNLDTGITDGSWHYLAIVFRKSLNTIIIYVDGVSQPITYKQQQTGTNFSNFQHPLALGAHNGGGTIQDHLQGLLDDVRIFDSALATEEIQQIYQDGLN